MLTMEQLDKSLHGSGGDEFREIKVVLVRNNVAEELKPKYTGFAVEGNALDQIYVQNVAFRSANLLLKGTEFEMLPWEDYPRIKKSTGDYAFIKRIDSCNYAYLYVDYYYHT